MRNGLTFLILIAFLFSCKKEKETEVQVPESSRPKVIILNEGNFRSANASVDIYYPDDNSVQENIYNGNNGGRPLGDVAQSMSLINGEYWLVVNNSNKIEIIDPETFTSKGKIEGFNSPRYCEQVSSNKVYVSDLYEDKLYVVDPSSRTIIKTIESKGWLEEMKVVDNYLFACHMDSNQVYVFNIANDSLIKKIPTNEQPHSLELDAEGMLWIACSGGYNSSEPALHRIDPKSFQKLTNFVFTDITKSIGDIAMNASRDQLFFLFDGLIKISIKDSILSAAALIAENGRNYYAMDIDPSTNDIYLADAIDYQQRGQIYRYTKDGTMIHSFKSGLIPGFFYFEE